VRDAEVRAAETVDAVAGTRRWRAVNRVLAPADRLRARLLR
jgi:hypothetical protein